MAKITSKLQVTIPKHLAEQYNIAPGDVVDFVPAGDVIHLVPAQKLPRMRLNPEERLRLFDAATARQREREKSMPVPDTTPEKRDWSREDLYTRGKTR